MVKIIFFGTSNISKIFLENLYQNEREILCITMPDKAALRGQKLNYPAVKSFAIENQIPYMQPQKFEDDIKSQIENFKPALGIAVAYGKIIPDFIFNIPKLKTFNIHFSLLPKYRGAAPVQYALCNGETETGVTSFFLEKSLDSGDIIIQKKILIAVKDNAETLFEKLTPLGIDTMNESIEILANTKYIPKKQIGIPSFAPIIKKEDGLIDWSKNAVEINNKIKGLYLWPSAFSYIASGKSAGKRIKIMEADIIEADIKNKSPAYITDIEKTEGFIVSCGIGKLLIKAVHPENKSKMSAWDFLQGRQIGIGDYFK
ncbi:MAG: methionyl-tRNA formyltransferase [Elusimicrobiota bacterium]|jgi:methionyl-tRNA formyltransferase|nr:methionyl-tRNA formyltransferase [Elusimicrobiota bacterium]